MNWIVDHAEWIGGIAFTGISALLTYLTTKKNRVLNRKLIAADAKLKELQVNSGNVELNDKVNKAVELAVERMLKVKSTEILTLQGSYENQIAILTKDLVLVRESQVEAERLKREASNLADSYKRLINKLRAYNIYLKGLLDENGITYKTDDEL